jgi:hypothetical protein
MLRYGWLTLKWLGAALIAATLAVLFYLWIIEPYEAGKPFSKVASLSMLDIDRIYRDVSVDGYEVNWFFDEDSRAINPSIKSCRLVPFTTHEDKQKLIQRDACMLAQYKKCHDDGGVELYRLYQLKSVPRLILTYEKSRQTRALCAKR